MSRRMARQRRRWGTQAPCWRLRAKPALQTQRKEPLVFTQRSLLHSSPRWFSSRHSSMSGGGGDRCGLSEGEGARATPPPKLLVRVGSAGPHPHCSSTHFPPSPGRALTDTACSGGVKLETAGTLAHCSAWPRYAATANATALVRILLRAVLFCAGQENRKLTPPQRWPQPRLCPLPLCSPRGGFPKSRGLASQKELLSLCDVGHWDPGRGDQWSVWSMHPDFHPHTPSDRSVPAPSRLTSTARRARAALGAPTAALATAAVIEGEGGPSKGARAHAILFSLTPAHIPPLRGSLCGGGPGVREESKLNQERPACAPTHSRGGCSPRAPHGRQGPGVGPGRPSPSPAGLSGSWQSRPEGPGTQGRRHSQR